MGYRRMCLFINRDYDKHYNKKRIHRIMKIMDVHSSIRRTRTCCTVANKTNQTAENVLHRDLETSKPNEKWTTDVTEFKVPHSTEKLDLSVFLDLYDRSIIA
nr:IS3 family transposase [Faecalicoccus pleomorphus]